MIFLKNRAIIYILGPESKSFLQGLITNDINKVSKNTAIYAFMLTPQGRFLYDFFIIEHENKLLVDCSASYADEIVKKLNFYKLRAKVEITKSDLQVAALISKKPENISDNVICYEDPRSKKIGSRLIGSEADLRSLINSNNLEEDGIEQYNYHRLGLKLPDDTDLTYDKSFVLEYGFENFHAIDYQKGCYVGQEVTARTHYRGVIRKKVFLVQIDNLDRLEKGTEIFSGEIVVGNFLSSVFYNQKLYALALIKNLGNENEELKADDLNLCFGEDRKAIKIIS